MIKSYLKIAWRNLFRNKAFSVTNLLGLAIGMTCTLLILLWVQDEINYDKFHSNYKDVYQVIANRDFKNQMFTDRSMVFPLASTLQQTYPQIKNAVVTTHQQDHVLAVGETKLTKKGLTVSDRFFDLFTWKVLAGNPVTAIHDPSSIVITASTARALFGNENPMNKTIRFDNETNYKVGAVLADVPGNSTLQFEFVNPFDYSSADTKRNMQEWTNSSWQVFVQPQPGISTAQLTKNINDLKKLRDPNDKISSYFVYPMNRWHLYSDFKNGKSEGGMIEYVRLFSVIAIIILLIACINFMNLSTARSEKRAKEVGIRKTLGSEKWQLIIQFFMESLILAVIAFIISVLAVYLLLPAFNLLVDKKLSLNIFEPLFWLGTLVIISFTGIIAGSYPALYLSSFNPVKTLKGTFLVGKKAAIPRHILVVGQFTISILLISATIIVYQQIEFIRNRSIGYNQNKLISITSSPEVDKNYEIIKNDLLTNGHVASLTRLGGPITGIQWRSGPPEWPGKPENATIIFSCMETDVDLTKTLGVKFIEGKDFSGMPVDSTSVILNKTAVEMMKIKNPVGMVLKYGDSKYTVIGITEDVVMESPFDPVAPMMTFYNSKSSSNVVLRLKDNVPVQTALASVEQVFKKYNPAFPFEYNFVDQDFGKKFTNEELIRKITNIFAGLAIFICCIGLAGLASFTIEKRIREIGIRKVLGANVRQVLTLISKQFIRLAMISFVVAVPITWWLMSNWLNKYVYHIGISVWLFAWVGILIGLLTLIVVSLNTLRAALRNPVKSLRAE